MVLVWWFWGSGVLGLCGCGVVSWACGCGCGSAAAPSGRTSAIVELREVTADAGLPKCLLDGQAQVAVDAEATAGAAPTLRVEQTPHPRIVGEVMGVSMVVGCKPGAGGNLAADVSKSPVDNY